MLYITGAKLGNKSANNIHCAQISAEFEKIYDEYHLIGRRISFFDSVKKVKNFFIENLNAKVTSDLTLIHRIPLVSDVLFKRSIKRHIKRSKFEHIYSRSILGAHTASNQVATSGKQRDCRVALELHEPPRGNEVVLFEQMIDEAILHSIVCISEALMVHIKATFPKISCVIHVLHDGTKENELSESEIEFLLSRFQLPENFVGYSGHLYEGRADFVINLAKKMPLREFVLMGGEVAHVISFREKCDELDLRNITLLGHCNQLEVQAFNRSATCLIMPYSSESKASGNQVTANWMSPLKMFEYMASETPIISSDLPVLREILTEENAYICSISDIQSWIYSIDSCFSDPNSRKQAAQAKLDVREYSWAERARRIKAVVFSS
jgi:glycosyltransferase involved in cell wall biosynthesis